MVEVMVVTAPFGMVDVETKVEVECEVLLAFVDVVLGDGVVINVVAIKHVSISPRNS